MASSQNSETYGSQLESCVSPANELEVDEEWAFPLQGTQIKCTHGTIDSYTIDVRIRKSYRLTLPHSRRRVG